MNGKRSAQWNKSAIQWTMLECFPSEMEKSEFPCTSPLCISAHVNSSFLLPAACRTVVQADIVFLVDASWSVGQQSFSIVKDIMSAVVSSFQDSAIGSDGVRFGVTVFGDVPR